jgi:hypothetical protein
MQEAASPTLRATSHQFLISKFECAANIADLIADLGTAWKKSMLPLHKGVWDFRSKRNPLCNGNAAA